MFIVDVNVNRTIATITANTVTYGEELFEAILYAALVDSEQSSGNLVYRFSQTVNVVAVTLKDL